MLIILDNDQLVIRLVNRDKCIIVDPFENLDDDEKMAVLTDIANSDPV